MNTRIHYQYRDGGNYRFWGSVVVSGEMTNDLWKRILRSLDPEVEGFIAHQVKFPEVFGYLSGPHIDEPGRNGRAHDYDDETDHCWHSFQERDIWELTTDPPTDSRDVETLVTSFEEARDAGWRTFDPELRFNL